MIVTFHQRINALRFTRIKLVLYIALSLIACQQAYAQDEEMINKQAIQPPSFPNESLYINMHMNYPESALRDSIQGTVIVSCMVTTDGSLKHIAVRKSVCPALDSEALRIVSEFPRITPGRVGGKLIQSPYNVSVWFNIPTYRAVMRMRDTSATAERSPSPGYDLNEFINQHIVYPAKARDANISGEVIVKFVVNEDGSITEPKIVNPIPGHQSLETEAIRLMLLMPKWKYPAMQKGKPVKVYFTEPVHFILE